MRGGSGRIENRASDRPEVAPGRHVLAVVPDADVHASRGAMPVDDAADARSARDLLAHPHVRDDRFVAREDSRAMVDREHGASCDGPREPHDPVRGGEERVAGGKIDASVPGTVARRGSHEVREDGVGDVCRPRPHPAFGRAGRGPHVRAVRESRTCEWGQREHSREERGAERSHHRWDQTASHVRRG